MKAQPMMRMLVAAAGFVFAATAFAADTSNVVVSDVWMRASLGQVPTTAAYFKIENKGTAEDRLLSISTPVAGMAHLHESAEEKGVMQMRAVDALRIKPGETVTLAPGGLHVMVMSVKAPLKAGTKAPLVLTFERAGRIEVEADVRGLNDNAGHKH